MEFAFLFLLLSVVLPSNIFAYFITVDAAATECYHDRVRAGTKMSLTFEVVEGGFLDIDVRVIGPDKRVVHTGERETSQRFTFAAHMDGPYTYCFSNQMSSMTPKVIMFSMDIGELSARKAAADGGDGQTAEQETKEHTKLEDMIGELSQALHSVKREQEYMVVRERIHRNINDNTNSRVVMWAFFEASVIAIMTIGQVYYLKRFFEVRRVV